MKLRNAFLIALAGFGLATHAQASSKKHEQNRTPKEYITGTVNVIPKKLEPEELYKRASQVTVIVITTCHDGSVIQGTGFFINNNQVLTNWHMVRLANDITIIDIAGHKYTNGKVIASNKSCDLAAVQFEKAYNKFFGSLSANSNREKPGERVYVFGNPKGMEWSFTNGLLSAYRAGGAVFQVSAPIDSGSSGSPVFNEYGEVIGIITGGLDSKAEINFAISANTMWDALSVIDGDHPKGFNTGISNGLELRNKDDIALDNLITADLSSLSTEELETLLKLYGGGK